MSITINTSRARENNLIDFVFLHCSQKIDGATEIIIIILKRFTDTFADSFKCSKMNDTSRLVLSDDFFCLLIVFEVNMSELDLLLPGDFLEPLKALHLRVVEVIYNHYVVAFIN